MRSARASLGLALAALAAGCATTQQEAARLRVNSARDRASQLAVRVVGGNPAVAVQSVVVIRDGHRSALVVRLQNRLTRPVSDLPISVGILAATGRRVYLNGGAGLDYFRTHIPAIAPGGTLTWVFPRNRRLQLGAHLFAAVGAHAPPQVAAPRLLPRITVSTVAQPTGRGVRLIVRNRSSVPQFQIPVYAVAQRSGRDVAAGFTTIEDLTNGGSVVVNVHLLGRGRVDSVALEAPPTIFG